MFRPGSPLPGAAQSAGTSQPRPVEDGRRPCAAERVRTLVECNGMACVKIPGVEDPDDSGMSAPVCRTVTASGDVLLLVPGDCAAARAATHARDDDLAAVMEITDVAPVSVPHRVRGRAWVAGWLTLVRGEDRAAAAISLAERHPVGELLGIVEAPGPYPGPYPELYPAPGLPGLPGRPSWSVLRLEVGEAAVDDLWGAESVEPEWFARARPDPLAEREAELLQHLHSAHGDQVQGLCALIREESRGARSPHDRAVPVALDRFGLRVRCTDAERRTFDARFDFPEPLRDIADLRPAMRALFKAAH